MKKPKRETNKPEPVEPKPAKKPPTFREFLAACVADCVRS